MEDLLTAPSLTADQNGILEVIQQNNTERIHLKYPISGDWRNPIHFLEQEGESTRAVVFYTIANEVNARIALVKKDSNGWKLVSELYGDGPEINSVQILQGVEVNLLVEWGSLNPANRRLAVYYVSSNELNIGFREECSDILMMDFNNDSINDFLYVTAEKPDEPFKLMYIEGNENEYIVASEIVLSNEMDALLKLQFEEINKGRYSIYIDESIGGNNVSTEVFLLENEELITPSIEWEFDIFQLFTRQATMPSRSFYNINSRRILTPSDTAPRETIVDSSSWKYWYYLKDGSLGYSFASYSNIPLNFYMGIPDNWLDTVVVLEDEEDQRLFRFIDSNTKETLFEVKVLRVEENMTKYIEQGFLAIGTDISGIYRYMYKPYEGCSFISLTYITNHFYSVN